MYIEGLVVTTSAFLQRHAELLLLAGAMVLGAVIGVVIVRIASLTGLMLLLFALLRSLPIPVSVLMVKPDRNLSVRLWVRMLARLMGLVAFSVIYDRIGL